MKNSLKALKKVIIFLAGITVVIIGIILLPLPGPGLLIITGGLIILATEFEWAQKHLDSAKKRLKAIIDKSKKH